jgi:hypothetical protein
MPELGRVNSNVLITYPIFAKLHQLSAAIHFFQGLLNLLHYAHLG